MSEEGEKTNWQNPNPSTMKKEDAPIPHDEALKGLTDAIYETGAGVRWN